MPADKATSAWAKPLCTRYEIARSLYKEAKTIRIFCKTSSIPATFRKVSCWPANEASGKSSAVADERTANEPWPEASNCANAWRISCSRRGWNGASSIQRRISAPACAKARTSSILRLTKRCWIRSVNWLCCKKSRKAKAVVAKPVGTRTPAAANWEIISPKEAFLPPTDSTSVILSCSKGNT